jgi:hypothetical protein
VFPDAQVVWTHRDPYECMASVMSLMGNSQPMWNNVTDIDYMAGHFPRHMGAHLSRTLEFSREQPGVVHHVYYDDLVSDPIGAVRRLYGELGDDFTPAAEAGMNAWLAENPQGRFGKHAYSLEQWGLSKDRLRPYFADYLKAHPLAR